MMMIIADCKPTSFTVTAELSHSYVTRKVVRYDSSNGYL